jgi:hypothetical protein
MLGKYYPRTLWDGRGCLVVADLGVGQQLIASPVAANFGEYDMKVSEHSASPQANCGFAMVTVGRLPRGSSSGLSISL